MKKAAEYFIIFLMIQFVSITLANGVYILTGGRAGENIAGTAIAMSIATFILVIAVFVVWIRKVRFSTEYLMTKPYMQLACCSLLGVASVPLSLGIEHVLPEMSNNNEELFNSIIASPMGFATLVVLGPVSEEIVFRGAILKALDKVVDRWVAIILSALLFAAVHFNPAQLIHAFLMGMLLAWICIRLGSILPCIVIHIINNGMAFVFIKYYPEVSLTSTPLLVLSVVVIIISLWGIMKTARQ